MARVHDITPSRHRFHAAVWLAVVLALQLFSMGYMRTAMASGLEVCSSAGGIQRVDGSGKALPSGSLQADHDCCGVSAPFLPLAAAESLSCDARHETPSEHLGVARLAAEWLSPLSRGPPSRA